MPVRNPEVDTWCDYLHRVIVGRDALRLLQRPLPDSGVLAVLPSWHWCIAEADLGRKDRAANGNRMLMPVRLAYTGGAVQIDPADQIPYSGAGLGLTIAGAHRPEPQFVPRLASAVKALADDGMLATFEAIASKESTVKFAVARAHASLAQEVLDAGTGTTQTPRLLDPVAVDSIVSEMMYGSNSGQMSSMQRLLNLSVRPDAFVKVDPLRHATRNIGRDARTAVRVAIGDPERGSQVRRIARQCGPGATEEDIVRRYRLEYPKDDMGVQRVRSALSVRPSVDAGAFSLADYDRVGA